jgi:hypothetical protein
MNNKLPDPLDYILQLCESGVIPSKFDIFNAKDELKYLRGGLDYLRKENDSLREHKHYSKQDFK